MIKARYLQRSGNVSQGNGSKNMVSYNLIAANLTRYILFSVISLIRLTARILAYFPVDQLP